MVLQIVLNSIVPGLATSTAALFTGQQLKTMGGQNITVLIAPAATVNFFQRITDLAYAEEPSDANDLLHSQTHAEQLFGFLNARVLLSNRIADFPGVPVTASCFVVLSGALLSCRCCCRYFLSTNLRVLWLAATCRRQR